jgi:uncharacterized repeat protein (TIGR01451 family)
MEPRLLLATFTVQSVADDGSAGTLRWAILQANSAPSPGQIAFDLSGSGVRVIHLTSALPALATPVSIDATTQPGYAGTPLVQLDGSDAGKGSNGLVILGGASVVRGLMISHFSGAGLVISGGQGSVIQGNWIGTDATGASEAGNALGIRITGSSFNTIGGAALGLGNLVAGNRGDGIEVLAGVSGAGGNVISGNRIGTTADGAHALPNEGDGVLLSGAVGTQVGDSHLGGGNVISGNLLHGLELNANASNNLIVGNVIGASADASHPLGNQRDGIFLNNAASNMIGGVGIGDGNVVASNQGQGIETRGTSSKILIAGNEIGTDPTGLIALGNLQNGILLGTGGNTVGGLVSGAGNVVAFNGAGQVGSGIQLVGLVDENTIFSNSIHDNAGLGINLGSGPTPNHAPGTAGPNDYQNYPILNGAVSDGTTTKIAGLLLGAPNSTYTVQTFWTRAGDPSGYGEGQHLINTYQVGTDSSGRGDFSLKLNGSVPPGSYVSATATDSSGNTSEFSPDVQVEGIADLSITLMANPTPVSDGGQITYTAVVTNKGSIDAHDVTLADQLAAGISLVSISASQGQPPYVMGQSVYLKLGTIAPGTQATATIVGQLQPGLGSISNSASLTLEETDPTPGDDSASVVTKVAASADVGVELTMSEDPAYLGDSVVLTMTATNHGPSAATGVSLSLPIPSDLSYVSSVSSQGSTSFSQGLLSALLGSLASGAQATVSVTVTPTATGTITTTASVNHEDEADPHAENDQSSVVLTVSPSADLRLTITPDQDRVATGQPLTYAIQVVNQGPSTANGVAFRSTLPAGASLIQASTDVGAAPVLADGVLTAALGDLPAGAVVNLSITVRADASPGSTLLETASVSAGDGENDRDPSNNTAAISTPVRDLSQVSLQLTAGASSIAVGQPLSYTLVATNSGPADEPDARITISLPPGVDVSSVDATQGTSPVLQPGEVTADLGFLPVGSTASVTFTIVPRQRALGNLTISAVSTQSNVNPQPADAVTSATVVVTPTAGLSVSVSPQTTAALQGVNFSYTIDIANGGPSSDPDVTVVAPLPPGVEFVSATSSQGSAPSYESGALTVHLGTLDANQTAHVVVIVRPSQPSVQGIALAATATGVARDPNPADDTATAVVVVHPTVDLSVTLVPDQSQAQLGASVGLTAIVTNKGPSPATGVLLSLPIPFAAQFLGTMSATAATGAQGGTFVAQLGTLDVGQSATVSMILRPTASGSMLCAATATADQAQLVPGDNEASVSVSVPVPPGVLQFSSSSYVVDERAGAATITVTRTQGALGRVSVHYTTAAGNATPGVDYVPVAGVLTFADGQTQATIVVPVLANPHDNHDEYVGLVLSDPTDDATLGALGVAALRIHDIDPDLIPPQVSGLSWSGTSSDMTSLQLSFSEPISASTLSSPLAYQLLDLGTSGTAGAPGAPIGVTPFVTDPSLHSVTLVPAAPLLAGHFYRVQVVGTGPGALLDLAGNPLAGAGPAGSNYVVLIGQGTTLRYNDSQGNNVTLRVTGGGYLDLIRSATGDAQVVQLVGAVAHRTTLSGTVTRPGSRARGVTTVGSITGLGQFGDVRVSLKSPPFLVRQYPFFLGTGRPLSPVRQALPAPRHGRVHPPSRHPALRPAARRRP